MLSGMSHGLLHKGCPGNAVKAKVDKCSLRSPGVLHAKGTLAGLLKLKWVQEAKGSWGTPCWGYPVEGAGAETVCRLEHPSVFHIEATLAEQLKLK